MASADILLNKIDCDKAKQLINAVLYNSSYNGIEFVSVNHNACRLNIFFKTTIIDIAKLRLLAGEIKTTLAPVTIEAEKPKSLELKTISPKEYLHISFEVKELTQELSPTRPSIPHR